MIRQVLAITTCRVSTPEQEENNSLDRQAEAVIEAANMLGAVIPTDGQWSGSVSSKAGTNVHRKDLQQMLDYCRKHTNVKYLIVHEVDRFMRSIKELFYFEVMFEQLGVKVWYASQPELNDDDYKAKLFKALEAFKGEGSNVERQMKSVAGDVTALRKGHYPFAPKPGYKKGIVAGVQDIHEVRGPILKSILIAIASKQITPTQGLIKLNDSDFTKDHSPYKMDKFRKIVTDPFYAGILVVDKQVKHNDDNGIHEHLITKEQHFELVKIMSEKKKNQKGPRQGGNPEFPCNNLVSCDKCRDGRGGRVVGFNANNGKPNSKIYPVYRCRGCNRRISRQELHSEVEGVFQTHPLSEAGIRIFTEALNKVWRQQETEMKSQIDQATTKLKNLNDVVAKQVEAAIDPGNAAIKADILDAIEKRKKEVTLLGDKLEVLKTAIHQDKEQFMKFAFNYIKDTGKRFLDPSLSPDNRERCKQAIFPAGFWWDNKNKVYTPKVSPLITLQTKKKDAEASNNSQMVRVRGL